MNIRHTAAYLIISFLSLSGFMNGQPGHSISVTVDGASKATVRLAYHVGSQQYVRDSLVADSNGRCNFTGADRLPPGVYMIVLPGNTFFEFLVGDDQYFDISCDAKDPGGTLSFRGSEENQRFLDYQKKWKVLQEEAVNLSAGLRDSSLSKGEADLRKEKLAAQEKKMKQYLHQVAESNKGTLLGAIAKSIIPPEPFVPILPPGTSNRDSVSRLLTYIHYKDHFFDNVDLSQPGLIRSPILGGRLEQFFRQVVIQMPDSIIREADRLLGKSAGNDDVFQYVAVWIMNRYASSEIMGHDAVVVHLADKVYLAGKAPWATKEYLAELEKRVNRLRSNLIGQKAPELLMNSFAGHYVSLYDVEADYTIVYFWEPDCGHCKVATPILRDYYKANRDKGIEVFAVCTHHDREKWEKYIVDNGLSWINGWDPERLSRFDHFYNVDSTPLIYILDREKKIIAKRLAAEDVSSFIDAYKKFSSR
ncbi:MAG: thioredoxin-like domain-containing protein [Bacteroidales bacterium]|nr:thioredoxin-like domain-containing protein [Bacteroidales bacterium]MDT8372910.1 thioredoxin-like domain-containing protein [Bacteroidales bacterium]